MLLEQIVAEHREAGHHACEDEAHDRRRDETEVGVRLEHLLARHLPDLGADDDDHPHDDEGDGGRVAAQLDLRLVLVGELEVLPQDLVRLGRRRHLCRTWCTGSAVHRVEGAQCGSAPCVRSGPY